MEGKKKLGGSGIGKTVVFEKKYDVNVKTFPTTEQVDKYMGYKLGRALGTKDRKGKIVASTEKVSDVKLFNLPKMLNRALLR